VNPHQKLFDFLDQNLIQLYGPIKSEYSQIIQ